MKSNEKRLIKAIETADWDDLTRRLLAYTAFQLSQHQTSHVDMSKAAPDYVVRAVSKLLGGEVDSVRGTLFATLAATIREMIEHDRDSVTSPDAKAATS